MCHDRWHIRCAQRELVYLAFSTNCWGFLTFPESSSSRETQSHLGCRRHLLSWHYQAFVPAAWLSKTC